MRREIEENVATRRPRPDEPHSLKPKSRLDKPDTNPQNPAMSGLSGRSVRGIEGRPATRTFHDDTFRTRPGAQAQPARRAARRSGPPARSGHRLRRSHGRYRPCSPPTSRGERLIPRMVLRADLCGRDPTGRRWRRGDRFSDRGNRFGRSVCRTAVRLADVDRRIVDLRTDASGGTGRVYTASGDGRMPAPCEPYSCWSSNSSECSPGRRRRTRR